MALWPTVLSDQCPSGEIRHHTFCLFVLINSGVRFRHWWEIFSARGNGTTNKKRKQTVSKTAQCKVSSNTPM